MTPIAILAESVRRLGSMLDNFVILIERVSAIEESRTAEFRLGYRPPVDIQTHRFATTNQWKAVPTYPRDGGYHHCAMEQLAPRRFQWEYLLRPIIASQSRQDSFDLLSM